MDVDIPVPDISSPTSELTLSEETIKRILLKYACVAIRCGVKDPITLAFSEGIRSHLSKVFYCICFHLVNVIFGCDIILLLCAFILLGL